MFAIATLALGGCGSLDGQVVHNATGEPVAGAVVELRSHGWGSRNGQFVWDAEKVHTATTDEDGRFSLDASGGSRIIVTTAEGVHGPATPCSRSPMLVRIGGPLAAIRADQVLMFGGSEADRSEIGGTPASTIGLTVSGPALSDGDELTFAASGGVMFVEGTGAIPAPPPLPYPSTTEVNVKADCGWLFVADGRSAIAVIDLRPPGTAQQPGGERVHTMLFTPLPVEGSEEGI